MSSARHPYRAPAAERRGSRPLRVDVALGIILACAMGAVLCIALVSWLLCSQSAGTALCTLAAPALPVRGALRRLWLRWLMWCNTRRMAETERQIAQYRLLIADDQLRLLELRSRLATQQTRQLVLASEQ